MMESSLVINTVKGVVADKATVNMLKQPKAFPSGEMITVQKCIEKKNQILASECSVEMTIKLLIHY